jgi:chromosome segregation protein
MFVSRLELHGFKSFAQPTRLLFPEGLTAIVGPNGCGKSNIVDAVRWVLGEQRLSVLRCESLEQLIFNGSRAHKPLGMAEVSLTVENTAGILPVEFSQVVVTRRVYRNGESEFLLNGVPCRLRDIQELFLDTGFAPHSYSVIELRMVEELLNGRPEERRRLLEEAAGIGKYKIRRREAQRKLEQVQQDMQRLEDLLAELRAQALSLQLQAEQARQWHHWDEECRNAERLLLALQWRQLSRQLRERESSLEQRRHRLAHAQQQLEQLQDQLQAVERLSRERWEAAQEAAQHQQALQEQLQSVTLNYTTVHERRQVAANSYERLCREQDRMRHEQELLQQRYEQLRQDLEQLQERCAQLQQHSKRAEEQVAQLRMALRQQQQLSQPLREQLEQERRRLLQLRVDWERIQARRELLQEQSQRLQEELHALDQRRQALLEAAEQIRAELHSCRQEEEKLRSQLLQREEEQQRLTAELRHLHQQREQRQQEIVALTARRQWLESLVQEHSLLQSLRSLVPEAELATVADMLVVPEELRKAFVAAIASLLEVPVLEPAAFPAVRASLLPSVCAGSVLFLSPEGHSETLPPLEERPGVLGWLWQKASIPPAIAQALQTLLGRIALVETLEAGEPLLQHRIADALVTPEGIFLHRCGLLRWSDGGTHAPWLGRRHELEELERLLGQAQEEVQQLEALQQELEHRLRVGDPQPLREAVSAAESRRHRLQAQLEQLQQQLDELARRGEELRARREHAHSESEGLSQRGHRMEEELRTGQQQLAALEEQLTTALREEEQLRTQLEQATQELHRLQQQWFAARHEEQATEQAWQELQRQQARLHERRHKLEQEKAELETLLQRLSAEEEHWSRERERLEQELQQHRHRSELLRRQSEEARRQWDSLRQQSHQLQQQIAAESEQLHAEELRCEQLRTQLQTLQSHFVERFALEPSAVEIPDPAPSQARLQQRIRTAEQELQKLEPVNFRALHEYEQLTERLQFLQAQYADLQQAAESLQRIIAETHAIAVERFRSAFEQVRRNFQRLFRLLFGESDEADLRLGQGDPLEAPIEILAKPRGKRPQLLEQLSGGEKTLVAIAFLFALYLLKPSPFCILDEIDAPLDDANIDRFLRLLRSFSEATQFLLITHNKRTMEGVDTLYGVTMQPEGVSKVVAIRLRTAEAVR